MGCCVSTTNKAPSAPHNHRHSSSARSDASHHVKPSRAPPPCVEEETVKEVLSETPTTKPAVPKIKDEEKKNIDQLDLHKIQEEDDNNVDKKPLMFSTEDISEVSEICSLSESVSTVAEKRDDNYDDGAVRQRVVDRSPAKFRNRSFSGDLFSRKEKVVGKSPAKRSEPSPGRVRSAAGRERRGLVSDWQRRDIGDSSRRRSRSPAMRTDSEGQRPGLCRSPSVRRTGKSPGRVRSDQPESTRKVEETNGEGKWPPTTNNESLENPLVSLECFIFL